MFERQPLLKQNKKGTHSDSFWKSLGDFFSDLLFRENFDIHSTCKKGDYQSLMRYLKPYLDENGYPLPDSKNKVEELVNQYDYVRKTPLFCVVQGKSDEHLACAQLLLRLGANPTHYINPYETIINVAAVYSCTEMVALIASYGAEDQLNSIRIFPQYKRGRFSFYNEVRELMNSDPDYTDLSYKKNK